MLKKLVFIGTFVQKIEGLDVEKGNLAQKLFYLSLTGNFTTQRDNRGV